MPVLLSSPQFVYLNGTLQAAKDPEGKVTCGWILLQTGETGFAKSNRHYHLVVELSAAPQHLVEGDKAKTGQQPSTRHCWVFLEQRARTVIIVSLSNFSFLDFMMRERTHTSYSPGRNPMLLFSQ